MGKSTEFNLEKRVDGWILHFNLSSSEDKSVADEIKNHFLEIYSDLSNAGLNDQEAFFITSRRLQKKYDIQIKPQEGKRERFRIGRSLNVLGGILAYYLFYYFTKSTARALLCGLLYLDVDPEVATAWYGRYFLTIEFIIILLFVRIFFMENKMISFIEKLHVKPKHTLQMLIATVFFAMADISGLPIVKWFIRGDEHNLNRYWSAERTFIFTFPMLICVGFVVIYAIYYKRVRK